MTLVQDPQVAPAASQYLHWEPILIKLLDWPFLLFLALIVILVVFRVHLIALLTRGDISIGWGDRTIHLRELSQNLDRELDPIRDELDALKKAVAELTPTHPIGLPPTAAPAFPQGARERILEALRDARYDWRSIESLAQVGGLPEPQTIDLLRTEPSVVLGMGKSGSPIAGLKDRVRRR